MTQAGEKANGDKQRWCENSQNSESQYIHMLSNRGIQSLTKYIQRTIKIKWIVDITISICIDMSLGAKLYMKFYSRVQNVFIFKGRILKMVGSDFQYLKETVYVQYWHVKNDCVFNSHCVEVDRLKILFECCSDPV